MMCYGRLCGLRAEVTTRCHPPPSTGDQLPLNSIMNHKIKSQTLGFPIIICIIIMGVLRLTTAGLPHLHLTNYIPFNTPFKSVPALLLLNVWKEKKLFFYPLLGDRIKLRSTQSSVCGFGLPSCLIASMSTLTPPLVTRGCYITSCPRVATRDKQVSTNRIPYKLFISVN